MVGSWEDVAVSQCFKANNLLPEPTRDKEGRERFLPFTPENHVTYAKGTGDWYEQCAYDLKVGYVYANICVYMHTYIYTHTYIHT
jgi:hypothetical protein